MHAALRKRLVKTPKLHFVDSGLLCYLLGIRSADELFVHPLRGAVFESWVTSEVRKAFVHRGIRPDLWFYRDSAGLEVDLVLRHAGRLLAIECKSGSTLAGDSGATLRRFGDVLEAATSVRPTASLLVYGGGDSQGRAGLDITGWRDVGHVVRTAAMARQA